MCQSVQKHCANSQTNDAMSGLVGLNKDLTWRFDLMVVNIKYFTFCLSLKKVKDRGKVKGH